MLKQLIIKRIKEQLFLAKPKVYLAGPMEYVKDFGTGWRNEIEPILKKKGFDVFNPANEVKVFKEIQKNKELENDIKGQHIWFNKIIRDDLKEVITSDIVVCRWFDGVFSAGTSGELTVAKLFNIPVLIVCDDVKKLPKWILGCITSHQKSFKGISKNIKSILKSRGNK